MRVGAAGSRSGPLMEKNVVGSSRKASLRRCSLGCYLSDTNQLYKNIGEEHSRGEGTARAKVLRQDQAWQVGRSRRKAPGSESVEWVRPGGQGRLTEG